MKMPNIENPFKEGYLWFPPHGVLGQLKKSWHKKYCQLFKCSKHGIDRLEVFDSEEEVGKTSSNIIITLENCIKIMQDAQKHQSNVFVVITKSSSYYFSANSEEEMHDWIHAFQMIAFKDNVSRQTIEEDNDLYCSSGDAGIFSVRLVYSEASARCGLNEGHYYILAVTPVALQLHDSDKEQVLYTWPYRYIRRYGYRSGKFTFEAGRKCESGEGVFHFEHSNQQEIFRCISSKMKNMKKLLNGETSPVVCSDNQFQAVSLMVARSRSPLPPSPNGSTTRILDSDLCPISSVKPLMPLPVYTSASTGNILTSTTTTSSSSSSGGNNSALNIPPPLRPKALNLRKTTAVLPPSISSAESNVSNEIQLSLRKLLPNSSSSISTTISSSFDGGSSNQTSDTQLSYDDVDISRFMVNGTAAVHSPPPKYNDSSNNNAVTETQKIFVPPVANPCDNYDHLQHLGTVPKQSTAPGYRQIPLIMKTTSVPTLSAEEPIFSCRRADDFQGYGMIRKKSVPDIEQDFSKQPYAIVCKPNRV